MSILKSYAKINLFLHITGKIPNNYHLLDSMVVFAEDLYDEIEITEGKIHSFEVIGPWAKNLLGTNIVETVLEKFSNIIEIPKFYVKIKKNIPIGSGLGGGSGNAAAVIRYLVTKFGQSLNEQDIIKFCTTIGADVPACYYSESLYFRGIGEIISPIKTMPTIYGVIIYPNLVISTKDAFALTRKNFRSEINHIYNFDKAEKLWSFLSVLHNDLLENAKKSLPILDTILDSFSTLTDCRHFSMTGSGSAFFGIFETKDAAIIGASTLQKKFPEYSVYVSKLK